MFIGNANIIGYKAITPSGFTNQYSLLFDGVDESVNCGTISSIGSNNTITLSMWVKFNSATFTGNLFGQNGTTSHNRFRIYYTDVFGGSGDRIIVEIDNGTNSGCLVGYQITPNTSIWYHIAMVYDAVGQTGNSRVKIYVNGNSVADLWQGTIPTSTVTNANNWIIGAQPSPVYMDECSVFDYALDSTQITSIYNSGQPTDLDNTSGVTAPVHWWRMGDGDTYPTINDVGTTGGNNGTMTNMESGDIQTDVPS